MSAKKLHTSDAENWTIRDWDRLEDLYTIERLLKRNGARSDPIAVALRAYVGNDLVPSRDVVKSLLADFWSRPNAERCRILNGWTWNPVRVREFSEEVMHTFLSLHIADKRILTALFVDEECGATHPVTVNVRVGSSRDEVLACLERATRAIDAHWNRLISNPDDFQEGAQADAR